MAQALILGVGVAWAVQKKYAEMFTLHSESVEAAHADHKSQSVSKPEQGHIATSTSIRRMQASEMQSRDVNTNLSKNDQRTMQNANASLLDQQAAFDASKAQSSSSMTGVVLEHYRM